MFDRFQSLSPGPGNKLVTCRSHAGDLGPCAPELRCGSNTDVFVSEDRVLPVNFAVASSRLEDLTRGRLLDGLSERAYHGGVEYLLRVGPAGAVPGASRLVRVRFTDPVYQDDAVTVALRWEATGATGALFPALDADVRLSRDGPDRTRVMLTGSYRPPLGALGAQLDRLLLRTVAAATIRVLLIRIGAVLEGAPAEVIEAVTPWQSAPAPEGTPG